MFLEIKNLHVSVAEKEVLTDINLQINAGEMHVIMGPNGSGKSTLVNTIMGNPKYTVTKGSILFQGTDITQMPAEKRAQLGLFLAFQYPREIQGVQLDRFLYLVYKKQWEARHKEKSLSILKFQKKLKEIMETLKLNPEFMKRSINEGFSGGEKKKCEMVQVHLLEPLLCLFDETDSGLDVDALKVVGESISAFHNPNRATIIVTHYARLLSFVKPDVVHIMQQGRLIKTGDMSLVKDIETKGFTKL